MAKKEKQEDPSAKIEIPKVEPFSTTKVEDISYLLSDEDVDREIKAYEKKYENPTDASDRSSRLDRFRHILFIPTFGAGCPVCMNPDSRESKQEGTA